MTDIFFSLLFLAVSTVTEKIVHVPVERIVEVPGERREGARERGEEKRTGCARMRRIERTEEAEAEAEAE
jgi:hypothetical protein